MVSVEMIEKIVDERFPSRRRGFYSWTMKKNFFSFHCLNRDAEETILPASMTFDKFYAIFCHALSRIRKDEDRDLLSTICREAARAKDLQDSPQLLNFLYNNGISIEEYFVAMGMDRTHRKEELFHTALSTFSAFHESADNLKTYSSVEQAFPVWSLHAQAEITSSWDTFLSYARIQSVCSNPISL